MISIFKISALTMLLFCRSAFALENQDTVATHVYEKVAKAVYKVEVKTSGGGLQGSAVAYRYGLGVDGKPSSTWLATNAHVVKDATTILLKNSSGNSSATYEAKVQYVDPELDIALIMVDREKLQTVQKITKSTQVKVGSRVYAIGSPLGLENTLSEGIVSGLRNIKKVNLIQTSAAISPGNSGGGLFNEDGELIGITTFKLKGGENLNFAVDVQYITGLEKAMLVANILVINIEELFDFSPKQLQAIHSGNLIKWLSRTQSDGGETLASKYESEHLKNMKMVSTGTLSQKEFFEKVRLILVKFLSDQDEDEKVNPNGAGNGVPPSTNRRFECEIRWNEKGENKMRMMPVYIDTTNKTINRESSNVLEFSDSRIKWKIREIVFNFSRYSGYVELEHEGVAFRGGQCREASERLI